MMADFKRRTLHLSTGKQIKLFGNSIAIGRSLEIGEGSAPNIFSVIDQQVEDPASEKTGAKTSTAIINPYRLTPEELQEIADYNIRLWMDLKDNIRKYGVNNPRLFAKESIS